MKKAQVQVGKTYAAKVSGRIVPVTLLTERAYGSGWVARNEETGRQVTIKSAAKLRYEMKASGEAFRSGYLRNERS